MNSNPPTPPPVATVDARSDHLAHGLAGGSAHELTDELDEAALSAPAPKPAEFPAITEASSISDADLQPIEKHYAWVIRATLAINSLFLIALVGAGDYFLAPGIGLPQGLVGFAFLLAIISLILIFPVRRVASIRYHMASDYIRIRRGFLFSVDSIVPFVRVQHIDVAQGPLERSLGLSRLTIHTSGVINQAVTLPGLATPLAHDMREAIHLRILTDAE